MKNSIKYNFNDFTIANYSRILDLAKTKYTFTTFTNFQEIKDMVVIWRHDVDYSPERAKKIALIEASKNIKSTYFINLHSEFYNLLEKDSYNCIQEIIYLGHEIGLHFDCKFNQVLNENILINKLLLEKLYLQKVFNKEIKIFSYHNPTEWSLKMNKFKYAGLINAYSNKFFEGDIDYVSDSNGYWRFKRLENVLLNGKAKRLQVLTHPAWWQDKVMSPQQRISKCIKDRAQQTKIKYELTLKQFGRKNID